MSFSVSSSARWLDRVRGRQLLDAQPRWYGARAGGTRHAADDVAELAWFAPTSCPRPPSSRSRHAATVVSAWRAAAPVARAARIRNRAASRGRAARRRAAARTAVRVELERELGAGRSIPGARQHAVCDVEVEQALVEPLTLADREEVELVARCSRRAGSGRAPASPLTRSAQPVPVAGDDPECAERAQAPRARRRWCSRRWTRRGVDPERDVVQEQAVVDARPTSIRRSTPREGREGSERVVSVEAEVAREVVSRPERDADEGQVALDRHLGDRRERAVARPPSRARSASASRARPSSVVALAEDVHRDTASRAASRSSSVLGLSSPELGLTIRKPGIGPGLAGVGLADSQIGPNGPWRCPARRADHFGMSERGLHRIEDDLRRPGSRTGPAPGSPRSRRISPSMRPFSVSWTPRTPR